MEGESGRKKECRGWFHVAVAVTFLTLAEAMVVFWRKGTGGDGRQRAVLS